MPSPLTADLRNPPLHRRKLLYGIASTAMAAVFGVALLDGVTGAGVYGVEDRVRTDGELTVQYPAVGRPALAVPFRVRVDRPGGFGEKPVELAVDKRWIELGDLNGLYPAPAAETSDRRWLLWEFDPPEGDVFELAVDFRIEPGRQRGRAGAVELRDGEAVEARVRWHTRIRP